MGLSPNIKRALAVALVLAAGCAQTAGGLNVPTIKSQFGSKNIVPSAAALSMESQNFCNAQAQVDYATMVMVCTGQMPTLPVSITTNYVAQSGRAACQAYGYVDAANKLLVSATVPLANCPTGTPVVPAVPAK